jgi:hypothetical protein
LIGVGSTYVDIVGDGESNLCIGIDWWRWIESSMGFVSFVLVDDSMIWRIRVRYSSLIRFDDWAGNDNNGFVWWEDDDELKGYIEQFNGSGGMIDNSLLFNDTAKIKI